MRGLLLHVNIDNSKQANTFIEHGIVFSLLKRFFLAICLFLFKIQCNVLAKYSYLRSKLTITRSEQSLHLPNHFLLHILFFFLFSLQINEQAIRFLFCVPDRVFAILPIVKSCSVKPSVAFCMQCETFRSLYLTFEAKYNRKVFLAQKKKKKRHEVALNNGIKIIQCKL